MFSNASYMLQNSIEKCKNWGRYFVLFFTCLYILIGVIIFSDYSASTDEPNERRTMYVNLNYITTLVGKEPMDVPELESYEDRYYGIFLQMPTGLFEVGHKGLAYIYNCRHLYTFSICVLGYIAFMYLCKKLFHSNLLALLGGAMVALYPRFFAEQFYNIKDMCFVAVYMFAMWATYMLIEKKFSWKWIGLFSFMAALATNVRIVGAVFVILLIGYVWVACIFEKYVNDDYRLTYKKALFISMTVIAVYFVCLIIMYPVAWKSPVHTVIDIFTKFSNYDDWNGAIVFMGKAISKEEIPWYYIRVWMLISIPVWYILLLFITGMIVVLNVISKIRKREFGLKMFF